MIRMFNNDRLSISLERIEELTWRVVPYSYGKKFDMMMSTYWAIEAVKNLNLINIPKEIKIKSSKADTHQSINVIFENEADEAEFILKFL